jgi:hypothetical protein
MKTLFYIITSLLLTMPLFGQGPQPFACTGSDGFGYYISSASSSGGVTSSLIYSSSRLSKIVTNTGVRTTVCGDLGIALNALAFNPHDNYLYAVSRYDATNFSGKLYRIGGDCQTMEIPVSGAIQKFSNNVVSTIDDAGGNISSGTFDLDNNYYVNTSFTNSVKTGYINKLQKLKLIGSTATVLSSVNLTCASGCTGKIQMTDIIYDEASGKLIGRNKETDKLYTINTSTGVMTAIGTGTTGIGTSLSILGLYKNRDGMVRAIDETGKIYPVNVTTGVFGSAFPGTATLNTGNADAASGCYEPPKISGHLFVDANGLTDNTVNGTGTNTAGTTPMYANLVSGGVVVKSSPISSTGFYQFLGLFSGTYEVQISSTLGTIGMAPPAQALPVTYKFVGDNIGTTAGSDLTPNGKITLTVTSGNDVINVNFGIDAYPVANNVVEPSQINPGGTTQVTVPTLSVSDVEDITPSRIQIVTPPNTTTEGTLYYNGSPVTPNQIITNYMASLLTFDPVDGAFTVSFPYRAIDAADLTGNTATATMTFTTVVPVTIIEFTGKFLNGQIILNWSTQTEFNSDYFIIESSENGQEYGPLGMVSAFGYSQSIKNYSFKDLNPSPINYYRLCAVDLDGSRNYSSIIKISIPDHQIVEIYPTFTHDKIYIRMNSLKNQQVSMNVFKENGTLILSQISNNGEIEVDLASQSTGIYIIAIYNQGKLITSRKILKG